MTAKEDLELKDILLEKLREMSKKEFINEENYIKNSSAMAQIAVILLGM